MALFFRRPLAAVAPGHAKAVIRIPRTVPAPGAHRGMPTVPLVPPWLIPARSGIGSAYAQRASAVKP